MRLGAGYEEKKKKKSQEEQQITPSIFLTYWSFNRFLKTDIEEDNNYFTLSSVVFHRDGP